eukprot:26906-Chlamydomonas_euryale.AAC.2
MSYEAGVIPSGPALLLRSWPESLASFTQQCTGAFNAGAINGDDASAPLARLAAPREASLLLLLLLLLLDAGLRLTGAGFLLAADQVPLSRCRISGLGGGGTSSGKLRRAALLCVSGMKHRVTYLQHICLEYM